MKAKFVYESLGDILKPKSEEEILRALETISISSYRLSSYFTLNINEVNILTLKEICKKLKVSPYEMNISHLNDAAGFIKNLFQKALKKDYEETSSSYYDSLLNTYKTYYRFSYKYKIITFGRKMDEYGDYNYYIFPRKLDYDKLRGFVKELIYK